MVTLSKADGANDLAGVSVMGIGASWDPTSGSSGGALGWAKRKRGVDLDLFAILVIDGDPVKFAGLDNLDPLGNGGVVHSGDAQTGAGAGDDETVSVIFDKVPNAVDRIVYVAAAYKPGSSFEKANNVSFKVYDSTGGSATEVADIWPSLLGSDNANAVAEARRINGVWHLEVLNRKGKIKQGNRDSLLRFALG